MHVTQYNDKGPAHTEKKSLNKWIMTAQSRTLLN